jgi:dipeptidyl aminopeptidase/acylaminoacyl peptidase
VEVVKALNKLGKTASLYMYPYADHHTGAKEIVLDRWTRWMDWLNHYVKNAGESVSEVGLGKKTP